MITLYDVPASGDKQAKKCEKIAQEIFYKQLEEGE